MPADYDGDGQAEPATYRMPTQQWFIGPGATPVVIPGVPATDLAAWSHLQDPAPADYDGDGNAEPAVVDETTGAWTVLGLGSIGSTGLSSSSSFNLVLPLAVEVEIPRMVFVNRCAAGLWPDPHCPANP